MTQAVPSIDRDEVDRLADELIRDHSGLLGNQTPPSYLSNANGLELASRVKALAITAAKSGLGFQFWEAFLNSGLHNAGNDLAHHSSHDRLTVSLRVELNDTDGVVVSPHKPQVDGRRSHSSTKPFRYIEEDILELQSANRRYRSGHVGNSHYDKLYEYFRFFCVNTFIHYTINKYSFGFKANGVSQFFDEILKNYPDIRAYSHKYIETIAGQQKIVTKETREKLYEVYTQRLAKNLDTIKDQSIDLSQSTANLNAEARSLLFLKSMSVNADDFAACVLNTYKNMSLSCLRIFFNFSSNVYLPWTVSASVGSLGLILSQSGPFPFSSVPVISLTESAGKIFQPINYPSYRAYNVEANQYGIVQRNLEADGKPKNSGRPKTEKKEKATDVVSDDHLGPMLIWPFRIPVNPHNHKDGALFQVGGFLRMMGRFDGKTGIRLPANTYAPQQFEIDKAALTKPVEGFFEALAAMLAAGKNGHR